MIRISGAMTVATENASRRYMPEEYVRTGCSMNSSSSEKSTMSQSFSSAAFPVIPMYARALKMFCRPLNSGLKPAPSCIRASQRPWTSTVPVVGLMFSEMRRSSVDLPAPFRPITANMPPFGISRLTLRRAHRER